MPRLPWTIWRYLLAELWRLLLLSTAILVLVISFAATAKPLMDGKLSAWTALKFMLYAVPPMLQSVRDAMAHGCFRPGLDDGELIAQTLWAAVHGLASLQISHGDCPWMDWRAYERRARLLCESTLRGLLSERAAREFKP
ncbi:hypothetical protein J4558_09855 [Leptolyngbya sp. 15MV]|nr:hypothetical protein J4558_09855 [Leptolyngbya sp. 15MV]